MTHTSNTHAVRRSALALAAAAALALALSSSGSAAAPIEGAAGGCALQCIEKALVTSTASSATVAIATTVRTRVVVTARRLTTVGRIDGPAITTRGSYLRKSRTLPLRGLDPERTYSIRVVATDASGHVASRSGKFKTQAVKTAVEPGPGGFSSGAGCSVKCITKAVPVHVGPTAALFEIVTNVPARITAVVSPAGTGSVASIATSPSFTKSFRPVASPLLPGSRYDLFVRATDSAGRTEQHRFTFRTVERKARVTFWKVGVVDDGRSGSARAKLNFGFWLGGQYVGGEAGFHRRGTGDVFDVTAAGTSRPGITGVLPVNGSGPKLDVRVIAQECTALVLDNCAAEVVDDPSRPGEGFLHAGGLFGLGALLGHGALPGSFGTMLPPGHDAYLVFETTRHSVKFRVYAYADFFYAW